jgi:hypothetical protein
MQPAFIVYSICSKNKSEALNFDFDFELDHLVPWGDMGERALHQENEITVKQLN